MLFPRTDEEWRESAQFRIPEDVDVRLARLESLVALLAFEAMVNARLGQYSFMDDNRDTRIESLQEVLAQLMAAYRSLL